MTRTTDQIEMFSCKMWAIENKNHNEHKDKIVETLKDYQLKNHNRNVDHIKTYLTSDDLQHNVNFEPIVELLKTTTSDLIDDWNLDESQSLGINKMWASITGLQGLLRSHHVPFSFLYGMYFVHTPPESGMLRLDYPTLDKNYFYYFQPREVNAMNSKQFVTPIPEGTCVLFPSHLNCDITPNYTEEDRIIIHFSLKVMDVQ